MGLFGKNHSIPFKAEHLNNKSLVKIIEKTEMTKAQLENDLTLVSNTTAFFNSSPEITSKCIKFLCSTSP